jgi:hypothetical protein
MRSRKQLHGKAARTARQAQELRFRAAKLPVFTFANRLDPSGIDFADSIPRSAASSRRRARFRALDRKT